MWTIAGIPDAKNTSGKTSETSAGTVSDANIDSTTGRR